MGSGVWWGVDFGFWLVYGFGSVVCFLIVGFVMFRKLLFVVCGVVVLGACGGGRGPVKAVSSTTVERTTTTVEDVRWAADAAEMAGDVQAMLGRLSDALDTESMVLVRAVCEDGFSESLGWIGVAEAVPFVDVRTPLAQAMDEYNTMFMYCADGDLESALPFLQRANAHAEQAGVALDRHPA